MEFYRSKYEALHEQVLESMDRERRLLAHAKRLQQDRLEAEAHAAGIDKLLGHLDSEAREFEAELGKVRGRAEAPAPADDGRASGRRRRRSCR